MMFDIFSGKSFSNPLTLCIAGSILIHFGILGFLFQSRSSFLLINQPIPDNHSIELIPIVLGKVQNQENSGNGSGSNEHFEGNYFHTKSSLKNDRNGQANGQAKDSETVNPDSDSRLESRSEGSIENSAPQRSPAERDQETPSAIVRDNSSPLVLAATPSDYSLENSRGDSRSDLPKESSKESIDPSSSVIQSGSDSESRNLSTRFKPKNSIAGRSEQTGTGASAPESGQGSDIDSRIGSGIGSESEIGSGQGQPSSSPKPTATPTPIPSPEPTPEPPPEEFICIACPPPPRYPHSAHLAAINGTVQVIINVDRQGFVTTANLGASSGSAELDNAAIATVRNWQFTPTRSGRYGVPVYVDFELVP